MRLDSRCSTRISNGLNPTQSLIGGRHRGFQAVRQAIEAQLEVFDEF